MLLLIIKLGACILIILPFKLLNSEIFDNRKCGCYVSISSIAKEKATDIETLTMLACYLETDRRHMY
jgi:hypothetical protein